MSLESIPIVSRICTILQCTAEVNVNPSLINEERSRLDVPDTDIYTFTVAMTFNLTNVHIND